MSIYLIGFKCKRDPIYDRNINLLLTSRNNEQIIEILKKNLFLIVWRLNLFFFCRFNWQSLSICSLNIVLRIFISRNLKKIILKFDFPTYFFKVKSHLLDLTFFKFHFKYILWKCVNLLPGNWKLKFSNPNFCNY